MRKKVGFSVLWIAFFVAVKGQNGKVSITNKILLDTSLYTVIKYGPNEWIPFGNVKSATLTRKDIENMESLIISAVKKHNLNSKYKNHTLLPLQKYKRQYVAVMNKNRQKVVWINFFCTAENKSWKKEIIVVQDGGVCYFNVKVNLTKKATFQLYINSDG